MPVPIPNNIRELIIQARADGRTVKEIERIFNIKKTAIYDLFNRYDATGDFKARANPCGRKPALSFETLEAIERKICESPDVSLSELKDELDLPICISALCRIINNKLHLVRKKTLHVSEQNRADVIDKRDKWKDNQSHLDPNKLVFLDESGINTGMTRLYGRSKSNERVIDYVPDVRFERVRGCMFTRVNGNNLHNKKMDVIT